MRCVAAPHNTEDRTWWYKYGEMGEAYFIEWICPELNIDGMINPEKVNNPTVPDLIMGGRLSDLKTQKTPFFTAARYSKQVDGVATPYDPTYTVTFNVKDFKRYDKYYPDIDIYFWVKWKNTVYASSLSRMEVDAISGVWVAPFAKLKELILNNKYPIHQYIHRRGENGNARDSYLIDLRDLTCLT